MKVLCAKAREEEDTDQRYEAKHLGEDIPSWALGRVDHSRLRMTTTVGRCLLHFWQARRLEVQRAASPRNDTVEKVWSRPVYRSAIRDRQVRAKGRGSRPDQSRKRGIGTSCPKIFGRRGIGCVCAV